jgi:hypothetical protein
LHGLFKCTPSFEGRSLNLLSMLKPGRRGISDPKVHTTIEWCVSFGKHIVCNRGTQVEYESGFVAIRWRSPKTGHNYVIRRHGALWPRPGALIAMMLKHSDIGATGEVVTEREAGTDGRYRKDGDPAIKRIVAYQQLAGLCCKFLINSLPIDRVGRNLEHLWGIDDKIRRQSFFDRCHIKGVIASEYNRSPARSRPAALWK